MSSGELSVSMARRLRARPRTTIDATRGPAIKRNVHEVVVAAPAHELARAFEAELIEPGAAPSWTVRAPRHQAWTTTPSDPWKVSKSVRFTLPAEPVRW